MNRVLLTLGVLGCVIAGVIVHGCALTSSEMSCSLKNKQTGLPERCIEYSEFSAAAAVSAKASLGLLCKAFQADIEDKKCDATTALAGCTKAKDGSWLQTEWYWSTVALKSSGDVSCSSPDTKVGPDRQPLASQSSPDLGGACSPATASAAVTINWVNGSGGNVTTFWVNSSCQEVTYQMIAAGQTMTQSTFVGHVWRVRKGTNDLAGTVLKEFAPKSGDVPAVTVQIP